MSDRLLTTADVAEWLVASEDWVRDHAAELGGIRRGDGPRSPLRFQRERIDDYLERRRLGAPTKASRRRPGPGRRQQGVPLLAIPEGRL